MLNMPCSKVACVTIVTVYVLVFVLLLKCGGLIAAVNISCGTSNISGSGYNSITDIHIIGFFPCTDHDDTRAIPVDNCDGIERIPIMKLALEEINERCDLLPGYRLVVDYANSACSSIPAIYHLIQQTDPSQPTKLMILGPGCSEAAEIMGEIAERFLHIPQVAYTASSSLFGEDKRRYPRFYRLVPITEQLLNGQIALIRKLNWNRVMIISYENELYLNIGLYTAKQLTSKVLAHVTFTDDPSQAVRTIMELNARIIIAWVPHSAALTLWCMVIKEKLAGPDFVWFFPGWYRAHWWAAVDDIDCSAEEMSKGLEHSLGARENSVLDNNPSRVLVSNKNVSQFMQDLNAKTSMETTKSDIFLNFGYVYDAVWTIALALNSSISMLEERGLGRLEDFTYDSVEISNTFTEAILNVSFEGISGKVSFQKNGNRNNPSVRLVQYRDGIAVPITIYDPSNSSDRFITLPGQSLKWRGGYIPRDGPRPEAQGDDQFEVIIAVTATSLGIISTVYFFLFNIYYRKHVVVKKSSYRLNSVILVGVIVGFVGTLLHVVQLDSSMSQTSAAIICNVRYWMTQLAFMVCFGTLFVKIWRLYKVFFNKRMTELKYLEDKFLLLRVALITTPTLVILIVQAATYPITLHSSAQVNKDNVAEEKIFYLCKGEHDLIFNSFLFIGDMIIGLVCAVLAFEIKKRLSVDNEYSEYNESAVINLTTMIAIILSSISEAVLILFQLNNIHSGILLIITLRECLWLYPMSFLLFIPKVYRVYYPMIWPTKQVALSRQVSTIRSRTQSVERNIELSTPRNRNVHSNEFSSDAVHSDTDNFKCKPKIQKRVSFILDTSLTMREDDENDSEGSIQD